MCLSTLIKSSSALFSLPIIIFSTISYTKGSLFAISNDETCAGVFPRRKLRFIREKNKKCPSRAEKNLFWDVLPNYHYFRFDWLLLLLLLLLLRLFQNYPYDMFNILSRFVGCALAVSQWDKIKSVEIMVFSPEFFDGKQTHFTLPQISSSSHYTNLTSRIDSQTGSYYSGSNVGFANVDSCTTWS